MAVQHFSIKCGTRRVRLGGHGICIAQGAVTVTVDSRSQNASFPRTSFRVPVNSSVTIPFSYVGGADSTCIAFSAGTVTPEGLLVNAGSSDITVTVTDTKARVSAENQFPAAVSQLSPEVQFVAVNSSATISVQYNPGYSASDVEVSVGTLSGGTWTLPVTTSPVSATIGAALVRVDVSNLYSAGISSLSPAFQYVQANTSATVTVEFNPGYSAADAVVSTGQITGTTWTIPVGSSPVTATVTGTVKVLVQVTNQFSAGIVSLNPASQYVPVNSTATVSVQFAPGYSAEDVTVSAGSISGTTWSIPVVTSPVTATVEEYVPTPAGMVHIGEHDYPTVQIGNRIWIAQNLYEPLAQRPGESLSNQDSRWAADDSTNANGYGMVYWISGIRSNSNNCRTQIEAMLPSGWRIPTHADIDDLRAAIPSGTNGMKALMLPTFGGNNSTGFNGASAGQAQKYSPYCFEYGSGSGTLQLVFLSSTSYNSYVISHSSSQYHNVYHSNSTDRLISLRVCRDA